VQNSGKGQDIGAMSALQLSTAAHWQGMWQPASGSRLLLGRLASMEPISVAPSARGRALDMTFAWQPSDWLNSKSNQQVAGSMQASHGNQDLTLQGERDSRLVAYVLYGPASSPAPSL
jgi:hypothetical protein